MKSYAWAQKGKPNGIKIYCFIFILPSGTNDSIIHELYLHKISSGDIQTVLCTPSHGGLMHPLSYILCLPPRTAFRSHSAAQIQCGGPLGIMVHLQGPHVSISAPGFSFLPHLSSGVDVHAIPTLRLQT